MKLIYIADISIADSPHVRASVDDELVGEYSDAMKRKDRFPPVELFDIGNKIIVVGDGLHRIAAHVLLKRKAIEANVRKGTFDEALLFALAANNKHGARMTREDKRSGVVEALKRWPERTDNYLAEVCFVSNHFVKDVRGSLVVTSVIEEPEVKVSKDNRKIPTAPVKEPEPPKPKPTPEKPKAKVVVVDDTGWPIPEKLLPMWERNAEVQSLLTKLSRIKGFFKKKQEEDDPCYREIIFSNVIGDMEKVYQLASCAKAYAVCTSCQGRPEIQPKGQCLLCKSKGLISRFRWNTAVPVEIKQIRIKQTKQTKDK